MDESGIEPLNIDAGRGTLVCATTDCGPKIDESATMVVFTEDGINSNLFTNSPDDDSNLKTALNASRGADFSVEYDNLVTGGIGFSTTTIVIDAGAEWNSGQEIESP